MQIHMQILTNTQTQQRWRKKAAHIWIDRQIDRHKNVNRRTHR